MSHVFDRLAPNAVLFQLDHDNKMIRWVGNEAGVAPDPNWNTVGGPDGKPWAPVECCTTLYDHYWFWSADKRFIVDGDPVSRWGAKDADPDPWVEVDMGRPRKFARANVNELAARTQKFRIEFRNTEQEPWRVAYEGQSIGEAWSGNFDRVTGRFVRSGLTQWPRHRYHDVGPYFGCKNHARAIIHRYSDCKAAILDKGM